MKELFFSTQLCSFRHRLGLFLTDQNISFLCDHFDPETKKKKNLAPENSRHCRWNYNYKNLFT